jgi:hypothetical protein
LRWCGCGLAAFARLNFTGMKHMGSAREKSSGSGTSTKRKIDRRSQSGFVVCINNVEYPASLELHKIYRVLPDADAIREGDIRVVDESGDDYLYPVEWFIPVEVPRAVKNSLLRASKPKSACSKSGHRTWCRSAAAPRR